MPETKSTTVGMCMHFYDHMIQLEMMEVSKGKYQYTLARSRFNYLIGLAIDDSVQNAWGFLCDHP